MVNLTSFTLLAGGYTTFLTRFTFTPNADCTSGSLVESGTFDAGNSPSWIERSPVHPDVLYATNEVTIGSLLSFSLASDGSATLVQNASSSGNGPAFANTFNDGSKAFALNYGSGDASFFTLSLDGLGLTPTQNITFPPPSGGVSHPHFFLPYGDELFVVDLGADKVWRLAQSTPGHGDWQIKGFIPQPTGSGPRRAVIIGDAIYVLHETANTLTAQFIPTNPSTTDVPIVSSVFTTPAGVNASDGTHAAAELLFPSALPGSNSRYLYVSNRDISSTPDPLGDTVAIFSLSPTLQKVGEVHTGLNNIRGMEFGGPGDVYLAAAGVAANGSGVAVLERTEGGKGMEVLARNNGTNAQLRSTFVWL